MFFDTKFVVHGLEVVEIYVNLMTLEDNMVTSKVKGVEITFDKVKLGEILNISSVGLAEYILGKDEDCVLTSKFTNGRVTNASCKVLKGKMPPFLKLLF